MSSGVGGPPSPPVTLAANVGYRRPPPISVESPSCCRGPHGASEASQGPPGGPCVPPQGPPRGSGAPASLGGTRAALSLLLAAAAATAAAAAAAAAAAVAVVGGEGPSRGLDGGAPGGAPLGPPRGRLSKCL